MSSEPPLLGLEDDLPDDDDSSADESDGEPIVPLAAQREKRINQGNRMRALLEEEGAIEEEELFKEEEDDVDFQAKDEEDVFDSDFGSTDSGSGGEDEGEDAGERQLIRDAKVEQRELRGKKKKSVHIPFLPSFARQTKHQARQAPVASTSAVTLDGTPEGPPPKKRKRSYAAVNALAGVTPRESSRKSAVAFKKTIEVRLMENEQRRASLPKPTKKAAVSLTQADLISEALETEEINRASLLAFYAAEEDRRAADRIAGMRYEIVGPKLTFLSRLEGVSRADKGKGKEVNVPGAGGDSAAEKLESGRRRLIEVIGEAGKEGWRPNMGMGDGPPGATRPAPAPSAGSKPAVSEPGASIQPLEMEVDPPALPPTSTCPTTPSPDILSHPPPTSTSTSPLPLPPPLPSNVEWTSLHVSTLPTPPTSIAPPDLPPAAPQPLVASPSSAPSATTPSQPVAPLELPSIPTESTPADLSPTGPHARNYLILTDFEGTRQEEMGAIFGTHHQWGSLKVFPSRSRVLNRKVPICPLTGLPAPYRDPRTMTPYSSSAVYKTLTAVTDQSYGWDPTLGAFTGKSGWGLQSHVEARHSSKGKGKASADNPYGVSYGGGAGARAARNRERGGTEGVGTPGPSSVAKGGGGTPVSAAGAAGQPSRPPPVQQPTFASTPVQKQAAPPALAKEPPAKAAAPKLPLPPPPSAHTSTSTLPPPSTAILPVHPPTLPPAALPAIATTLPSPSVPTTNGTKNGTANGHGNGNGNGNGPFAVETKSSGEPNGKQDGPNGHPVVV